MTLSYPTSLQGADIVCFDMKFLTPTQMEALQWLIDDDPDLICGGAKGPKGYAVIVASSSMLSTRPIPRDWPPDRPEPHMFELYTRLTGWKPIMSV